MFSGWFLCDVCQAVLPASPLLRLLSLPQLMPDLTLQAPPLPHQATLGFECRTNIEEGGPTLKQHWLNIWCLGGFPPESHQRDLFIVGLFM